jgi:hypothetical protein
LKAVHHNLVSSASFQAVTTWYSEVQPAPTYLGTLLLHNGAAHLAHYIAARVEFGSKIQTQTITFEVQEHNFRHFQRGFDMTKCVKVLKIKAKAKSMDQSQARIWVGTV